MYNWSSLGTPTPTASSLLPFHQVATILQSVCVLLQPTLLYFLLYTYVSVVISTEHCLVYLKIHANGIMLPVIGAVFFYSMLCFRYLPMLICVDLVVYLTCIWNILLHEWKPQSFPLFSVPSGGFSYCLCICLCVLLCGHFPGALGLKLACTFGIPWRLKKNADVWIPLPGILI